MRIVIYGKCGGWSTKAHIQHMEVFNSNRNVIEIKINQEYNSRFANHEL